MTCRDCIHNVICSADAYFKEREGAEAACVHFKPKSRFIELPLNVGDDIYWVYYTTGEIEHFIVRSMNIICLENNYVSITIQFEKPNGYREFNYQFSPNRFGDCVFLTKEEAEKALERSNNEKV